MRAADEIVPVTAASHVDIADLVTIAAASTWETPAAGWLVPDPDYRSGVLHAWYSIVVEHALRYGRVDLLADRSAAAIWLNRTRPVPAPDHFLRRLTGACGMHANAVLRYEGLLAQHAPRSPHWQLAILAAPGPAQVAVLLAHRHHHLDRIGVAAQTTVSSSDQVLLLTAVGYQPGDRFPLPDRGPVMQSLWRPPGRLVQ